MNRPRAFVLALPLAFAIGSAALTTAAPALAAKPAAAPAKDQAAAGWLARQMTGRSHFITVFNGTKFPNQGLTIDGILAFASTHSASDYAARAVTWLQQPS